MSAQLSFELGFSSARPVRNIYCGTCGWAERSLLASGFYPAGVSRPADRLAFYAQQFPVVEVNSSFHAMPSAERSSRWVEQTPPGFVFDVRAYSMLTFHAGKVRALPTRVRQMLPTAALEQPSLGWNALPTADREAVWRHFVAGLEPLASAQRLGVVLFQFPPWFDRTAQHIAHLEEIAARLPWQGAVEFRGGRWMEPEHRANTLARLEQLGLAYVMVDEPLGFASSTASVLAQTADIAVIRMHGRDEVSWQRRARAANEHFRHRYSREELEPWAHAALFIARQARAVHVLMNTTYGDHAVRNAKLFGGLLEKASKRSIAEELGQPLH